MVKKCLILWVRIVSAFLLFSMIAPNLNAHPVDKQQAVRIAQDFFASAGSSVNVLRSTGLNNQLELADAPTRATLRSAGQGAASADHYYYVFNRGNNDGFVIVAGDDQFPEIIGYSLSGSYNSEMPEHVRSFFQSIQISMDHRLSSGRLASSQPRAALTAPLIGAFPAAVSPLLRQIEWDQTDPWNGKTPRKRDNSGGLVATPVGCVATAISQIMRKWQWPDRGVGSYSYTESDGTKHSVSFNKLYDWANMPEKLVSRVSSWSVEYVFTSEQKEAYSTFCYDAGVGCAMNYTPDFSGAFSQNAARTLRENFRYDKGIKLCKREHYNQEDWERIIRTELAAGRPIYHAGYGRGMNGGHAFVCDGYNAQGLYHINLGWGGYMNGYYNLNIIDPEALGTGGGNGGYNYGQEILINIQPDRNNTSVAVAPDVVGREFTIYKTYNGFKVDAKLELTGDIEYTTSTRLMMAPINGGEGKQVGVYRFSDFTLRRFSARTVSMEAAFTDSNKPAPGTYRVYVEYRTQNGYQEIKHLQGGVSEGVVTVKADGTYEFSTKRLGYNLRIAPGTTPRANISATGKSTVTVSILNDSDDEYSDDLNIQWKNAILSDAITNYRQALQPKLLIGPGETKQVVFNIPTMTFSSGTKLSFRAVGDYINSRGTTTTFYIPLGEFTVDENTSGDEPVVKTYKVSGNFEGEGRVTVSGASDLNAVEEGTVLTINATPATGWELKEIRVNGRVLEGTTRFTVTEDAVIRVIFVKEAAKTARVTTKVIGEGTLSLVGVANPNAVEIGTKVTVKAEAKTGYKLESIKANGVTVYNNMFTLYADTEVVATFVKEQPVVKNHYVHAYSIGQGQFTITGAADLKSVPDGTELTVNATPAEGYELRGIFVNSKEINGNKFVVNAYTTVRVEFSLKSTPAPKTASITTKVVGEGTLSLVGIANPNAVKIGSEVTVKAEAKEGYILESIKANGVTVYNNQFTLNENTEVVATFVKNAAPEVPTHRVFSYCEGYGEVEIQGASDLKAVPEGTQLTVIATPAAGYVLKQIIVNFEPITGNTFIVEGYTIVKAVFEEIETVTNAKITSKVVGEGTVTFPGVADVNQVPVGTKVNVSVQPAVGYKLESIKANGVVVVNNSFVVEGDTEVEAVFVRNVKTHKVTVAQSNYGSIRIIGLTEAELESVESGRELMVMVTPETGYSLRSLYAGTANITTVKKFVVTRDVTVQAFYSYVGNSSGKDDDGQDTNVDNVEVAQVKVYPNPAVDYINVEGAQANAVVRLYTMDGAFVVEVKADNNGVARVDVAHLNRGIYLIQVGESTQRVMLK